MFGWVLNTPLHNVTYLCVSYEVKGSEYSVCCICIDHCVKVSVFGLNTERYSVSFRIQSKCGPEKLRIRTFFTQWIFPNFLKIILNLPRIGQLLFIQLLKTQFLPWLLHGKTYIAQHLIIWSVFIYRSLILNLISNLKCSQNDS